MKWVVPLGVDVDLEPRLHAGLLQDGRVPVHSLAAALGPLAHQGGVGAIGRVAEKLALELALVDLDALLGLERRAHRADVVAHTKARGGLLEHHDAQALLGGRDGTGHARGAGAHHEHVARDLLGDVELSRVARSVAPDVGRIGRRRKGSLVGAGQRRKGRDQDAGGRCGGGASHEVPAHDGCVGHGRIEHGRVSFVDKPRAAPYGPPMAQKYTPARRPCIIRMVYRRLGFTNKWGG